MKHNQEKPQNTVRFAEDDDNQEYVSKKPPIIGVNSQFLDPEDVKFSLTEEQVLLQEDKVSEYNLDETSQLQIDEYLEQLKIELIPLQSSVKLDSSKVQTMPIVLQIKTDSSKLSNQEEKKHSLVQSDRPPIDLVCVVDISGSMIGKKINLVKDSLRYLMKVLGPYDRISIVVFSTIAHIIIPWVRNTPENKERIKSTILSIQGLASTNLAEGVLKGIQGLWMLKNRQFKNPVSCMFLLSDGKDDYEKAELKVYEYLKAMDIQEKFIINTFGYGQDHDSYVMNQIATYKNGNFYYIEDIGKASEYFILSMSGMLSIFAQNVKVTLKEEFKEQGFQIKKVYGYEKIWFKDQGNEYYLPLNYLLRGEIKDYVFELLIPQENEAIKNIQLQSVISVILEGQYLKSSQEFTKETKLILILNKESDQVNEYVEVNYLRSQAGENLGMACEMASNKNYDEAVRLLDFQITQIEKSQFASSPHLQRALEDIRRSKELCKPSLFEHEGQAFMMKKERNHMIRQSSLSYQYQYLSYSANMLDWNDDQQGIMQNFEKGELALSGCGSNRSEESQSDSEYPPVSTNQIFRLIQDDLKKMQYQGGWCADDSDESDIESNKALEKSNISEDELK